jgi:PASTA domain
MPATPRCPNLLGQDTTLRTGTSVATPDTEVLRFGDFSSVAVDPSVSGGTCAITAQQYFGQAGPWVSHLSRLCGVQHVTVHNVLGGTVSAARTVLTAAGLRGDNLTTTTACDPSSQNLVVATSPMVTNQAEIGSQVTLITCDRNVRVPNVVGDTVDQATAAIQSVGLVVGTISNTTSCDVTVGEIASTTRHLS